MTHPFIDEIRELENFKRGELESLETEANKIRSQMEIINKQIQEKSSELAALRKYSLDEFNDLASALAVKPVCPRCFIFHDDDSILLALPSNEEFDFFRCKRCGEIYEIEIR